MKLSYKTFILLAVSLFLSAFSCSSDNTAKETKQITENVKEEVKEKPKTVLEKKLSKNLEWKLLRKIKHSRDNYTQGFFFHKGFLYEGTGQSGKSYIYKINPKDGNQENLKELPPPHFGEGICLHNGKIYQLSWRSGMSFVYDFNTLEEISAISYKGEGWGITSDGTNLYMTDGTNKIKKVDENTFQSYEPVHVFDENSEPINYLNEIEFIYGEIWANVYLQNIILRINPEDGTIIQKLDFSDLYNEFKSDRNTDVFNGIAFDYDNNLLYLTGKNWPYIFEIKLIEK